MNDREDFENAYSEAQVKLGIHSVKGLFDRLDGEYISSMTAAAHWGWQAARWSRPLHREGEQITMRRELAQWLLNSVEYLAMRADDIGTSNVPVADELRALLADHPLITCLRDNGNLIAARATIAHQAQMIEHLRGGLTTPTNIDVANADADGFKNGRKSVGLLLRKGFNTLQTGSGEYKIVMQFSDRDDAWAAYNEVGAITRLAGEE